MRKIFKLLTLTVLVLGLCQVVYAQDYDPAPIYQRQYFGPLQYNRRYFTTVSFRYLEDGTREYLWGHDRHTFGFVDENWNVVIAPKYDYVRSFVNGISLVGYSRNEYNFIDINGNYILQDNARRIIWDGGDIALAGSRESWQGYYIIDMANNFSISDQRIYNPVLSGNYVSARLSATGYDWAVMNRAGHIAQMVEFPPHLYTYILRHRTDIDDTYAVRTWEHGSIIEEIPTIRVTMYYGGFGIHPISNLPYIRENFTEYEIEYFSVVVRPDLREQGARTLAMYMSMTQESRNSLPEHVELGYWEEIRTLLNAAGRTPLQVYDVQSGETYNIIVMSAGNHADVEPASAEDAAIIESIGGHGGFSVRPVWVTVGGRTFPASTSQTTFAGGTVTGNNFDGWLCMHFYQGDTHNGNNSWRDQHREALVLAQNGFLILNAMSGGGANP